jgi:hypothetical protein
LFNPPDSYQTSTSRKTCNVSIPTHIPTGFQISLPVVQFKGFIKRKGILSRESFFAGGTGEKAEDEISSNTGDTYTKLDTPSHDTWSKCGKDVSLRLNSALRTSTPDSTISVSRIKILATYRACR